MTELTPWYKVVDTNDNVLFETRFYGDPSNFGSKFTFDDSDGNDWICLNLDTSTNVIHAELMSDWMDRKINEYNGVPSDNVTYGYVES